MLLVVVDDIKGTIVDFDELLVLLEDVLITVVKVELTTTLTPVKAPVTAALKRGRESVALTAGADDATNLPGPSPTHYLTVSPPQRSQAATR